MLIPKGNLPSLLKPKTKEWAHMVDVDQEITNFHELVPNMAKEVGNSDSTLNQPYVNNLHSGHLNWILFRKRLFIIWKMVIQSLWLHTPPPGRLWSLSMQLHLPQSI